MSGIMDIDQFKRDRNRALSSMDMETIKAYMRKYDDNAEFPSDDIFWVGVHKARTACLELPIFERNNSRKWLSDRGYQPL